MSFLNFLQNKLSVVEAKPLNSPELSAGPVEPAEAKDLDVRSFMSAFQGAQNKETLDEYPKVLKLAPKNEELFYFVTVTLFNKRRLEEAEQVANELIKLNPHIAEFQFLLSEIFYFQRYCIAKPKSKRLKLRY